MWCFGVAAIKNHTPPDSCVVWCCRVRKATWFATNSYVHIPRRVPCSSTCFQLVDETKKLNQISNCKAPIKMTPPPKKKKKANPAEERSLSTAVGQMRGYGLSQIVGWKFDCYLKHFWPFENTFEYSSCNCLSQAVSPIRGGGINKKKKKRQKLNKRTRTLETAGPAEYLMPNIYGKKLIKLASSQLSCIMQNAKWAMHGRPRLFATTCMAHDHVPQAIEQEQTTYGLVFTLSLWQQFWCSHSKAKSPCKWENKKAVPTRRRLTQLCSS